jgi:hypothetical protein
LNKARYSVKKIEIETHSFQAIDAAHNATLGEQKQAIEEALVMSRMNIIMDFATNQIED